MRNSSLIQAYTPSLRNFLIILFANDVCFVIFKIQEFVFVILKLGILPFMKILQAASMQIITNSTSVGDIPYVSFRNEKYGKVAISKKTMNCTVFG